MLPAPREEDAAGAADVAEADADSRAGQLRVGPPGGVDVAAVVAASVTRLRGEHLGAVVISFANGAEQVIGLRCEVLRPALQAAPSSHTFGVVRALPAGARAGEGVAEEARAFLTLRLANPTTVDAHWRLRHVPAPAPRAPRPGELVDWRSLGLAPDDPHWAAAGAPEAAAALDDPSCFAFSATQGVLQGPTAPLEAAEGAALRHSAGLALPAALQVVFRPKRAALYQCRFRLAVRAGESFEVLLRGRGTFEERDAAPS
jgi:hypothetical protein